MVLEASPDILNHNTETVPRLYRVARSGARYPRSLELLRKAKEIDPRMVTKTGVMAGLGESLDELLQVFRDLAERESISSPSDSTWRPRAIICRSNACTLRRSSACCGMKR